MKVNTRYDLFLLAGISFVSIKLYALPFNITPNGALPMTYPGTASYTITKNSYKNPTGNIIKWLPPNVAIATVGTTCATSVNTPFILDKGNQCILNLTVSGPVSNGDPNPNQHLMVCLSDRATCAGPSPDNSLNVSSATPLPTTKLTLVGDYKTDPFSLNQYPLAYYSEDGGQTWTQSTISDTAPRDFMKSVACGEDGLQCTAMANNDVSEAHSFSSSDGGKTWSGPFAVGGEPSMSGIACDSATGLSCVAVGGTNQSPVSATVILTTDGGLAWSAPITFPLRQGITSTNLYSVACNSARTKCSAVGIYNANNQSTNPIIYYSTNSDLSTWTAVIPTPVSTNQAQRLVSVACSSTGEKCTAVGYYVSSIDKPSSFYTTNGGVSWTPVLPELIAATDIANLTGIACDGTGSSCFAVGYYQSSVVAPQVPLMYQSVDGGASWGPAQHSFPLPTDADVTGNSLLSSISCDSAGLVCTAAGQYQISSNPPPPPPPFNTQHQALTYYTLNGGQTWSLSLPPPLTGNTSLEITGVA